MRQPQPQIVPAALSLYIPNGRAGTRETLKQMRRLVELGKNDLGLRDLAQSVIAAAPAKDWRGELAALLDFVRARVRYSLDTNDIETLQGARQTLALGYGDCDDLGICLCTLCELAGHPCALVALSFDPSGDFSHVMVLASGAGETEFIPLDPSENEPAGWWPPGVTDALYCPITASAEQLLGL